MDDFFWTKSVVEVKAVGDDIDGEKGFRFSNAIESPTKGQCDLFGKAICALTGTGYSATVVHRSARHDYDGSI